MFLCLLLRESCASLYCTLHKLGSTSEVVASDVSVICPQVMRIPRGGTVPDLVLGERLVPGDDTGHFCQPSDVAVLESGAFYVADGSVSH